MDICKELDRIREKGVRIQIEWGYNIIIHDRPPEEMVAMIEINKDQQEPMSDVIERIINRYDAKYGNL